MDIDCLCTGILFADHVSCPVPGVPEAGGLVVAEQMQLCLGGCASNAALDLARLGVDVAVAGCVGDDVFGRFIVDSLAGGGVDTAGIHRLAGINSASSMVINVEGHDRRFIASPGANTQLTVDHIPIEWVRRAKVFYVGGYFFLPGLESDRMVELFRAARQSGTKTVLDVVLLGGQERFNVLAQLLPETDVFLPNDDEAAMLTGLYDPLEQAEKFRDAGAGTVVITLGQRGSVLVGDGLRLRAGVYPAQFVGGTGAGDAFDAGYIAGLLDGEDPAGCLRWGSALGASCVRQVGATEGVFDRRQTEAFIREHPLKIENIAR